MLHFTTLHILWTWIPAEREVALLLPLRRGMGTKLWRLETANWGEHPTLNCQNICRYFTNWNKDNSCRFCVSLGQMLPIFWLDCVEIFLHACIYFDHCKHSLFPSLLTKSMSDKSNFTKYFEFVKERIQASDSSYISSRKIVSLGLMKINGYCPIVWSSW